MSDLRALVREILAEEIAALRAELSPAASVERVSVGTAADLQAFALSILRRADEPGFLAAVTEGHLRFEPLLEAPRSAPQAAPAKVRQPEVLVTTVPASIPELRKGLVTERDIAAVPADQTRLRITKLSRLTPLASDEARRRGLRIERTLT